MKNQPAFNHPGCRPGGYAALRAARCLPMTEVSASFGGTIGHTAECAVIRDALVICRNGGIEAVGTWDELADRLEAPALDLGEAVLCPGLVNAHTHVNLSHIRGKTASGQGFVPWVASLVHFLRTRPEAEELDAAIAELSGCATVLVGDIVSSHVQRMTDAFVRSPVQWAPMVEFIGPGKTMRWPRELSEEDFLSFDTRGISGHALYSTTPELLTQSKSYASAHGLPFVMHLAESPEETEMLQKGEGEMLGFYTRAGFVSPHFSAPGTNPVAYAHSLGLLDKDTLAIHCVQVDAGDMELLESSGATVCLCPRSNEYIGVGRAPWEEFFASSIPVCIGTDGLSSNTSLDLFEELRFMAARWQNGPFPWRAALRAVTCTPARVLKADGLFGSIAPGKSARMAVLPSDIAEAL